MRDYENKLRGIAGEKVVEMKLAKDLYEQILSHEKRQKALNHLLQEWMIFLLAVSGSAGSSVSRTCSPGSRPLWEVVSDRTQ